MKLKSFAKLAMVLSLPFSIAYHEFSDYLQANKKNYAYDNTGKYVKTSFKTISEPDFYLAFDFPKEEDILNSHTSFKKEGDSMKVISSGYLQNDSCFQTIVGFKDCRVSHLGRLKLFYLDKNGAFNIEETISLNDFNKFDSITSVYASTNQSLEKKLSVPSGILNIASEAENVVTIRNSVTGDEIKLKHYCKQKGLSSLERFPNDNPETYLHELDYDKVFELVSNRKLDSKKHNSDIQFLNYECNSTDSDSLFFRTSFLAKGEKIYYYEDDGFPFTIPKTTKKRTNICGVDYYAINDTFACDSSRKLNLVLLDKNRLDERLKLIGYEKVGSK